MGTIVGPLIQAMHLDGTSQYAWKANSTFKDASAGGVSIWFRLTATLAANGATTLFCVADSGTQVGTFGKYIFFCARRNNAAFGTGTYLDITSIPTGSSPVLTKSGSTALSAGVWYNVIFGSDGKIYLNGVEEIYQYRSGAYYTSGWFSMFTATNKDLAVGAQKKAGSPSAFFGGDLMNMNYLPGRSFTSTEAAEIYAAEKCAPPSSLSMYASLAPIYTFNGNTNDLLNVENLTAVASPTYISP